MRKKRKPHEERKPEDYMEAADNALELAKVLAGQGGIGDQDFLERMARSDELVGQPWTGRRAANAITPFSVPKLPVR